MSSCSREGRLRAFCHYFYYTNGLTVDVDKIPSPSGDGGWDTDCWHHWYGACVYAARMSNYVPSTAEPGEIFTMGYTLFGAARLIQLAEEFEARLLP